MKRKTILICCIISLIVFFSCGGGHKGKNTSAKQETPKALQDNYLEIKSYSRSGGDLTEELYQELVDKTPALKKLEDDLKAYYKKPVELQEKFNKFDGKSTNYYASAKNTASAISDSLLRNKMTAIIAHSEKLYSGKIEAHNSLLRQISQNEATLNDHHAVLKIILTLPVIEKYQDESMPDTKELKELINQQGKLISKIDSMTPKH